ncbi:hypothetical protein EDE15_2125 [Edaphobacter aggregans]|uniref:Uncharacterized protein n=1 Tax=Edaphobacter aggregans TaxID=570835 RepID=A0A3R9QHB4_9BACT|nr:hypothetical protein [Edaphobacter aggregans]RSL16604.1 hypothetical protein EDE15_2125 [Edaphobacter aggregans]
MNKQSPWSASLLRRDLNARAEHLAATNQLLHEQTTSQSPSIIFGRDDQARHGNFHPASYAAICANPDWARRLTKVHTAHRRVRARADWPWMELDCANSSDALLMNIFCHPQVFNGNTFATPVAHLLGVEPSAKPNFGIHPGVPLLSGLKDRTEIDLQLDNLFVEAKLTETSFQNAKPRLIERYRDLETVFDLDRLPRKILYSPTTPPPTEDFSQIEDPADLSDPPPSPILASTPSRTMIHGYQLIRNALATYASDASFCVLCDARRHDLIETWYAVLSAVHRPTFAARLKLLTWQELAITLPHDLQQFLDTKYGIVAI